jgi:hypothetical protein
MIPSPPLTREALGIALKRVGVELERPEYVGMDTHYVLSIILDRLGDELMESDWPPTESD